MYDTNGKDLLSALVIPLLRTKRNGQILSISRKGVLDIHTQKQKQ
jgi:hypothetical protein